MKKQLSLSKTTLFIRVAACLTAAVMLLSAAACNKDASHITREKSFTELNVEELDHDMINFLTRFTDWYYVEDGQKNVYDSKNAGDGSTNILHSILGDAGCADWTKYPVSQPKEVYNEKKLDPKKWAKESGGAYMVFNSKDADWVAVNIFNATEKDLETMREQGEKNKWFYLKDGKYFKTIGGVGDPLTEYKFESAKTDGTVYYVTYSSSFNNGEEISPVGSYSAEVEQKTIDGKTYWTLNKFEQTSVAE